MQYNASPAGINAANRDRLALLHRQLGVPFTVAEAAQVLGLTPAATRRFLAYLAARGWLSRIRRNLYVTVPLEATVPSEWREDPWVVAVRAFQPCYVGGWSACEHWGLTDQIFRGVVVITARRVRNRRPIIQGTPFQLRVVAADRLFGTEPVWRNHVRASVSDPSKTIVDMLDDPALGGGMRHIAETVAAYFSGALRNDALLLEYAERVENRTVYKRLGYLVEALNLGAPEVVRVCLEQQSAGITALDPTPSARGPIIRRWSLRLNVHISSLEAAG